LDRGLALGCVLVLEGWALTMLGFWVVKMWVRGAPTGGLIGEALKVAVGLAILAASLAGWYASIQLIVKAVKKSHERQA